MAALTSSGVTINEVWYNGDKQRMLKCLDVTLVLSTQGSITTNTIAASLFGLNTIEECSALFRTSTSVAVGAWPSYSGSLLVFGALETNGNPADVSVTVRGIVRGKE